MTRFCILVYRFFHRRRIAFLLVVGVLFVFCGYFASRIHLEEDINKLMPSSHNEDGSVKLAFADLKIKDKTFLLFEGMGNTSTDELIEVCDAFVDSLTAMDALNDSDARVVGNVFYCLPEDLMYEALDYVCAHLPAYIDVQVYDNVDSLLTPEHFKAQMKANYNDFQSPVGSLFPELIEMDPIGLRGLLAEQYKPLIDGGTGSYKTIDGHFFTADSSVCVAFITPHYSSTNTGQGSALFEMLNTQIKNFASEKPNIKICYHGTPASGFYNASVIKHDLKLTLLCSACVVLTFILLCFRRVRTILLLLLPVLFGALFGLSAMYFIRGQFSLLALGIGAVVLGVAFSYVLHVLTHYNYLNDAETVLRQQVKPICLGCLTTIGSFVGLFFIRTPLLQDFGLFAAFAIVGTTLFSLLLLPPLLTPDKGTGHNTAFLAVTRFNTYPFHQNRLLLFALTAVILLCAGSFLMNGIQFDADMHNLGYKSEEVSYSEELLRSKTYTGDKQKYFASSGATMEEALLNFNMLVAKLDSLQNEGLVKSYTHTNLLLVPLAQQQARIEAWNNYWTDERLDRVRELILAYAPDAGLNAEAFNLFFDCAKADYQSDAVYNAGLIPEGYLSTLTEQSYGGDYLCYTSVRCANDTARSAQSDYNRICDAVSSDPNLLVLDIYYYTYETLRQMYEDFNVLQWVSMLFVFVVLLLSFRFNLRLSLIGFLPILLSWIVTLGAMSLCGVRFNFISIIISTFIFGIGVDYSIFVMNGLVHRKEDAVLLTYHKAAIFFSAVILFISVGSMLFASHPAIRSVGFSTLVGLLSAVVFSFVLQPAIYNKTNKGE